MIGFIDSIVILSHLKRIFGLNVSSMNLYKVEDSSSKNIIDKVRRKYSFLWLIYAALLHTTHLTLFCSVITFNVDAKVSALDFGLDMMFTIVGAVGMVITVIWSLKNTERMATLKACIENFDFKFKMFGRHVDNGLTRRFVICEIIAVLIFWFLYYLYYVVFNCDYGTWKCFRNWFVTYHPHKILLVAFMEELALFYGLSIRFRYLNEYLTELEIDTGIDLNYKYLPSKVNAKNYNTKMKGNTKIMHCRELHYYLCDLSSDLNDMLSLQTVANILDCFVNIFVMLYLACFGYSRDVENSTANYNPLGILLPLFVGGEAFTKIYYMAKCCDIVQCEAKRTGEILHKISLYTLNEDVKNEILHFSQQVLHKNVHITACGMFPIDYSLVYNVIAAVTTFIVILIQFAMAIKYVPPTTPIPTIMDTTINFESSSTTS